MKQVQKQVDGDIDFILVEQLRDQAFMIDLIESEGKGESLTSNSYIFDKPLNLDFIISTPGNGIGDIKQEIQNLINKIQEKNRNIEQLREENSKKGK
jgi:hypothetical protein